MVSLANVASGDSVRYVPEIDLGVVSRESRPSRSRLSTAAYMSARALCTAGFGSGEVLLRSTGGRRELQHDSLLRHRLSLLVAAVFAHSMAGNPTA